MTVWINLLVRHCVIQAICFHFLHTLQAISGQNISSKSKKLGEGEIRSVNSVKGEYVPERIAPGILPTPQHRLMHDLFKYYRTDLRPVYNDSEAVEVAMHLWFKQVLKVDEIDQILTIYCWTEQYWNDQFLRWKPEDYDGITVLHIPVDQIWRPDILVYNNADMNINENELSTNVVLNYTGDLICFRAIITKITCNLDMTYFPFDQQKCTMMFASWSHDGSKVMVVPKRASNNLEYYIENTEWKLLDFKYVRNIKFYDCCPEPYPDITYTFILERNPSYYILNLIIPSVFITVVTMVGFFTPYSSTGENTEKVSLGVTALLSLAIILLMVADKMPATSKVIPLIGKYYIGLIWLIFAATIITTVTLRLQSKGNAGKPLAPETRKLFFDYIAKFLFMKVDMPPKHFQHANSNGMMDDTTALVYSSMENLSNDADKEDSPMSSANRCATSNHSSRRITANSTNPVLRKPVNTAYVTVQQNSGGKKPSPKVNHCEISTELMRLRTVVTEIDWRLAEEYRIKHICKEWEQLARVCERMLMIVFVFITVLFAVLMLHSHGQESFVTGI